MEQFLSMMLVQEVGHDPLVIFTFNSVIFTDFALQR